MADYIDREAVLQNMAGKHKGPPGWARKIVEEFPAADVRPERYASWVGGTSFAEDTHCSKCGQACSFYRKTPGGKWKKARFCPHCGAKMEGNDGT